MTKFGKLLTVAIILDLLWASAWVVLGTSLVASLLTWLGMGGLVTGLGTVLVGVVTFVVTFVQGAAFLLVAVLAFDFFTTRRSRF